MEGLAQKIQQVESILAEVGAEAPDPTIQRMLHEVQQPLEGLQQAVGQIDQQSMQSGLQNPGGPEGAEGAAAPAAGGPPGPGEPDADDEASAHHGGPALVIHIGAGGPKDFGSAKKAAMANYKQKGHFNPHGAAGEEQSTQRTKTRAGSKA